MEYTMALDEMVLQVLQQTVEQEFPDSQNLIEQKQELFLQPDIL